MRDKDFKADLLEMVQKTLVGCFGTFVTTLVQFTVKEVSGVNQEFFDMA